MRWNPFLFLAGGWNPFVVWGGGWKTCRRGALDPLHRHSRRVGVESLSHTSVRLFAQPRTLPIPACDTTGDAKTTVHFTACLTPARSYYDRHDTTQTTGSPLC